VHGLYHERLFAAEVTVERGLGNAGSAGDLVDRGAFDAYLGNEVCSSIEHSLTSTLAPRSLYLAHRYSIVAPGATEDM